MWRSSQICIIYYRSFSCFSSINFQYKSKTYICIYDRHSDIKTVITMLWPSRWSPSNSWTSEGSWRRRTRWWWRRCQTEPTWSTVAEMLPDKQSVTLLFDIEKSQHGQQLPKWCLTRWSLIKMINIKKQPICFDMEAIWVCCCLKEISFSQFSILVFTLLWKHCKSAKPPSILSSVFSLWSF